MSARSPVAVLVEDADEYITLGTEVLRREGFDVLVARDGESGIELVRANDPDFVLVDINLPGIDGFEVVKAIRNVSDVYVVMVTSRAEEVEKVVGFRVGADDYVTKPYSPAVLSARISAMRRRPRQPSTPEVLRYDDLTVDLGGRLVTLAGQQIPLTKIEFELLRLLGESPGRAMSRTEMLEALWGSTVGDAHVIDVHMANLRNKLGEKASAPRFLATVRGVGYRFDPPA